MPKALCFDVGRQFTTLANRKIELQLIDEATPSKTAARITTSFDIIGAMFEVLTGGSTTAKKDIYIEIPKDPNPQGLAIVTEPEINFTYTDPTTIILNLKVGFTAVKVNHSRGFVNSKGKKKATKK